PFNILSSLLIKKKKKTFAVGSRIPTLLPEKTLLVTNNSKSNYTINEILITNPDLYMNGAVVVHGIELHCFWFWQVVIIRRVAI
ncbi:hypothetical protein MKW94_011472, partial [Papaver nudicaule]|nr:hypothetical protein [Papaver nudicaule]